MQTLKFYFAILSFLLCVSTFAQVQINKQLQMTGTGTDAEITGIQTVTNSNDAVNVTSLQNGKLVYATATGSNNSFSLSINPPISAYQTGMVANFISNQNVSGPATLNVNGLGVKTITKYATQNLSGCEIINGQAVSVMYDGTNFQLISLASPLVSLAAPVATASTGMTSTQFTANWNAVTGATGYYLDVSTTSNFATFVSGYQNLDVLNNTSYNVTGLINCETYYYRVRAYSCVVSAYSDTVSSVGPSCPITQTECGTTYTYHAVTNPVTGRVWLDRNLGATEVATSSTDYNSYGSKFQFGRLADGHECVNYSSSTSGSLVNGTTTNLSSSDNPGNSLFIITTDPPNYYDWRNPENDALWQGLTGTNNPCPAGFRIATQTEWATEMASWTSQSEAGAYASLLKIPAAGYINQNASFGGLGTEGDYWSGPDNTNDQSTSFSFVSSAINISTTSARGDGFPVRCIKN